MEKKLPISVCILSWNSGKTIENTLKSYAKNGFLNLFDDITILFQEVSEKDIKIAQKYNIKYIGIKENIGIGKGIIKLVENTKYNHFLFLEHDWELVENASETYHQLSSGLNLLKNQNFKVIRFRSRKKPGHPLYSLKYKGKELTYYDDWHKVTSPHLLESLHWLDPAEQFPDKIQKKEDFFVTTSRWANWTNNPFLIQKQFYLDELTPFSGKGVQFEKNIAAWWVKQNFKIAQGEGLFMHHDLKKHKKENSLIKTLKRVKNKFIK